MTNIQQIKRALFIREVADLSARIGTETARRLAATAIAADDHCRCDDGRLRPGETLFYREQSVWKLRRLAGLE